MEIEGILNLVLDKGTGKRFYRFSNADGKVWLMPSRNMRVAMNLYQPSGRNGKLVKTLFPWLYYLKPLRKFIHAEVLRCNMDTELTQLCCRLFHVPDIEFSIFCGTPSVHQKITIQISRGHSILGYCKVTDDSGIAELFQRESIILKELTRMGFKYIPNCLFFGVLKSGASLFIQNTIKTSHSQIIHKWTALQDDFLDRLYQTTHRSVDFEKSDYYLTLIALKQHADWLPQHVDNQWVVNTLNKVLAQWSGKKVDFSAYHADFTPWNMFVESNRLFVFDWEYAQATYPPMLDRYHFFTQTVIFEKHWTANEIIAFLQSKEGCLMKKETYTLYLLDVIARFTIREKGVVNGDIAHAMGIWLSLLHFLNK
jgi:hypothetical protein